MKISKKMFTTLIAAILIVCCMLSGCDEEKNPLVGEWADEHLNGFAFYEDGTMEMSDGWDYYYEGRWKATEDRLTVFLEDGKLELQFTAWYSIDGYTLTIIIDGETQIFTRQN